MIVILLIDNQELTLTGLTNTFAAYPNFALIAYQGELAQIDHAIKQHQPRVLVMDPFLEKEGVEKLKQLKANFEDLQFLVLSNQTQCADIISIFELGIKCYVSKLSSTQEIIAGVMAAANHEKYVCGQVKQQLTPAGSPLIQLSDIPKFSEREKEIIHLIAAGVSDKAIAEKLFLSFHTIRTHRKNIARKLGFSLKNAAELVSLISYLNDVI